MNPKHYETYQNMSLWSNGVDWVCSLWKIPTWLRSTNFCFKCTSSPCFASNFMQLRDDPKCIQTICKAPKHEFRVQWGGLGAFVEKIPAWLRRTSFRINCTCSPCFAWVSCGYETIPNAPKHYATHQNMSLGSNGVDWVRSLQKIPMWHCGTYFCINGTSTHCFAPSFMQLRNDPKFSQTLCNVPKHEFRVQCGGLGAFVVKNPDVTLWHELLH